MLQTRKINKDIVAVAFEPTEILVRKSGRDYYGSEAPLAKIKEGKLLVNAKVAKDFGIDIEVTE